LFRDFMPLYAISKTVLSSIAKNRAVYSML